MEIEGKKKKIILERSDKSAYSLLVARDATEEKRIERVYAAEADRVGRVLETFYSLFLFFVRSPSLVAECPPDQMIPSHARARRYGSCRLAFDTWGRG